MNPKYTLDDEPEDTGEKPAAAQIAQSRLRLPGANLEPRQEEPGSNLSHLALRMYREEAGGALTCLYDRRLGQGDADQIAALFRGEYRGPLTGAVEYACDAPATTLAELNERVKTVYEA